MSLIELFQIVVKNSQVEGLCVRTYITSANYWVSGAITLLLQSRVSSERAKNIAGVFFWGEEKSFSITYLGTIIDPRQTNPRHNKSKT